MVKIQISRIIDILKTLSKLFPSLPELFANLLLDFIHAHIEDVGDQVNLEMSDKPLKDYFTAFLDEKDFKNTEQMVQHIRPEFLVSQSIALFEVVIRKMQERE